MKTRKASIKESGEEVSPHEWQRFDAAVAQLKEQRERGGKSDSQTGKKTTARNAKSPS